MISENLPNLFPAYRAVGAEAGPEADVKESSLRILYPNYNWIEPYRMKAGQIHIGPTVPENWMLRKITADPAKQQGML